MDEVKKSLKDLRKELSTKRKESTMSVTKLSRASIMAELDKYASPVKHVEREVEKIAKVKPSPKADKVIEKHVEEAVKEVRSKKNPRIKESVSSSASVVSDEPKLVIKKPAKQVAVPKPKDDVSAKVQPGKKLSAYQKAWGEARRNGMSPKEASEHAKKMIA